MLAEITGIVNRVDVCCLMGRAKSLNSLKFGCLMGSGGQVYPAGKPCAARVSAKWARRAPSLAFSPVPVLMF